MNILFNHQSYHLNAVATEATVVAHMVRAVASNTVEQEQRLLVPVEDQILYQPTLWHGREEQPVTMMSATFV